MASTSGAIRAGGAFVEVFAENNPLRKGLAEAGTLVKKFAKTAAKIATVTIGAGLAGGALALRKAMDTISDLDRLNKIATAFGLVSEQASGLFGVFKISGATNIRENVESLVTLANMVKQAASGGGGQGEKLFEGLNVSAEEMSKLDASEQFFRLHEAIMQLEDPAERINKLMLAFGEDGGKTLIATLSKSTEELRKQAGQFKVSQEQLDRASQAQAALNQLSAAYQKVWQEIAVAVAPIISSVADTVTDNMDYIRETFEWAFGGMVDAVAAGEMELAWEVMCKGLELAWATTMNAMKNAFEEFKTGTGLGLAGAAESFREMFPKGGDVLGEILNKHAEFNKSYRKFFGMDGGGLELYSPEREAQLGAVASGDITADQFAGDITSDLTDEQKAANEELAKMREEFESLSRQARELNERPDAPTAPGPSTPPPVEEEIVKRAASASVNNASIVGTSGAAQAIAKAMAQGKAAEWEKKNNSVLKDIHKEIKNRADVELGVV